MEIYLQSQNSALVPLRCRHHAAVVKGFCFTSETLIYVDLRCETAGAGDCLMVQNNQVRPREKVHSFILT